MRKDLGYADLNIPTEPQATLKKRVLRALELGYHSVAVNTTVLQESLQTRKEKKRGTKNCLEDFPAPQQVDLEESDYPELASKGSKPTILTRLTIVISSNDFLIHYNKSDNARNYDLLAVIVRSAQALQMLLKSSFRFDILSYDPFLDDVESFRWNRKLYREILDKHVSFELMYGPMIENREFRQTMISLAYAYNSFGKSRGIIITSGAKRAIELRPPTDVANLSTILNMTEAQGKEAVLKQCSEVYKAALGRKVGVFRVRVEKIQDTNAEESDDSSNGMDVK
jgi:ribonuclease P/MRP protein subunit RPP1